MCCKICKKHFVAIPFFLATVHVPAIPCGLDMCAVCMQRYEAYLKHDLACSTVTIGLGSQRHIYRYTTSCTRWSEVGPQIWSRCKRRRCYQNRAMYIFLSDPLISPMNQHSPKMKSLSFMTTIPCPVQKIMNKKKSPVYIITR